MKDDDLPQYYENVKKDTLELIKFLNFPEDHFFLDERFPRSIVFQQMILSRIWLGGDITILKKQLEKIRTQDAGKFSFEKYHQNLAEFTFYYYILCGMLSGMLSGMNEVIDLSKYIEYESPAFNNKLFDFSATSFLSGIKYNFEIKTITCEPIIKDCIASGIPVIDKGKYIKYYFEKYENAVEMAPQDYKVLHSQFRTIKDEIVKISKKFTTDESVNIGVVVCQFSSTGEEFFSYFFHPRNGLITGRKFRKHFEKFDILIFFTLTPYMHITMDTIREHNHTWTAILSERVKKEDLELFRLDNVFYYMGSLYPEIEQYAKEDCCKITGRKFTTKKNEDIFQFFREDIAEEDIMSYFNKIADYV